MLDDVARCVIDATRFLYRGLFFNDCFMANKADYFSQELLIYLPENFRWQDRELIGAVGVIETFEELYLIPYRQQQDRE